MPTLAALREKRHKLLQKRRLGEFSEGDKAALVQVETAMEEAQRPQVEAERLRAQALLDRVERVLRDLSPT
jgi:hypothetical protein